MKEAKEFYSRIIQLIDIKFVPQDTKITSLLEQK